ncbi:hypothetical protein MKS88_003502 [Plasmodium brasilianum]|uniref:Uncharacterized protein n=1 Tax=Plasmodium brasilianum TaxID=5824 RepID=A0ACB9Y7I7_PLABR|nr:hypothetical protein MKS88_003502 [Plasmodium brasilianum]
MDCNNITIAYIGKILSDHVKSPNSRNVFQSDIELRHRRIVAEQSSSLRPWERDFQIVKDINDKKLKRHNSPYLKEYNDLNMINQISANSSTKWKAVLKEMREHYDECTRNMDDKWKNYIWYNIWAKLYLQKAHDAINKTLADLNNSYVYKEKAINTWFQNTKEDMDLFISHIKSCLKNKHNNDEKKKINLDNIKIPTLRKCTHENVKATVFHK